MQALCVFELLIHHLFLEVLLLGFRAYEFVGVDGWGVLGAGLRRFFVSLWGLRILGNELKFLEHVSKQQALGFMKFLGLESMAADGLQIGRTRFHTLGKWYCCSLSPSRFVIHVFRLDLICKVSNWKT